jgi:tRNA threonylcarbamoyladenosine biosynthesis protein TsaB
METRVLAVTTSSPRGGVALVEAGAVLGLAEYTDLAGHAEQLFGALDRALAAVAPAGSADRAARAGLHGLVCDVGPGSFTGVRVGVASLKGIALATGLPLVGVGSLEAMASAAFRRGLVPAGALVLALLDAKKGEVFAAAYDAAGAEALAPRHLLRAEAAALVATLGRPAVVVGAVASELEGLDASIVRDPATDLPHAAEIAVLGAERLARAPAASLDPASLEPLYVRAPDAKPMAGELC